MQRSGSYTAVVAANIIREHFMVNLYYCDVKNVFSEANELGRVPDRLLMNLDETRKKHVSDFKFMPDKIRCAVAGELIYRAFVKERQSGIKACELKFAKEEYGKPYIENFPDFHFSLSHSGEFVVLSSADKPVGVDIQTEERNTDTDKLAEHFYSEDEKKVLKKIADPNERKHEFYRIWSAKEAFLKMTGSGLRRELRSFTIDLGKMIVKDGRSEGTSGYLIESPTLIRCIPIICFGEKVEKINLFEEKI